MKNIVYDHFIHKLNISVLIAFLFKIKIQKSWVKTQLFKISLNLYEPYKHRNSYMHYCQRLFEYHSE